MRVEIKQTLAAAKCLGAWLIGLSSTYLCMTALNWYTLDIERFKQQKESHWHNMYVEELFQYTVDIEEIKLIHGFALFLITLFIFRMTRQNKVLTRRQYCQLMFLTIFISLLYAVPVLYIAKRTFDESNEYGARLFADWTLMVLEGSDSNWFGVGLSVLIHMQIIMVIFAFQFITFTIKNAIRRLENMRDNGRGQYS